MEKYYVKFWMTNEQGYREQRIEEVTLKETKSGHKKAEQIVKEKYRQKPYLQHVDIISVIYG